ncbi:hypothetical protein EII34_05845 [Arachnia propionica]|uniref:Uncharacterized protein n=2 Tax=Arachnia propionica TaxID=1750 RepID=A0A3P1T8G2_9ACTN|nr:hypothetical protein [Arachnia propionica]RRD05732.1 hypothetical protein EII34_05845 [Arachnia propionica]
MKPMTRSPHPWFTTGRQETTCTHTGGTGVGRALGRGFFALGVGLTCTSEHQKMDKCFREEHPELTAEERNNKVIETATVRTGSQVAASTVAGAAVGSLLPVGGTTVDLAVGFGVGLLMGADPDGDDKSVGDNFADAGEAARNVGKNFSTSTKGLFGG